MEAHYIPCNANELELDLARTSPDNGHEVSWWLSLSQGHVHWDFLFSLEFAFQLIFFFSYSIELVMIDYKTS